MNHQNPTASAKKTRAYPAVNLSPPIAISQCTTPDKPQRRKPIASSPSIINPKPEPPFFRGFNSRNTLRDIKIPKAEIAPASFYKSPKRQINPPRETAFSQKPQPSRLAVSHDFQSSQSLAQNTRRKSTVIHQRATKRNNDQTNARKAHHETLSNRNGTLRNIKRISKSNHGKIILGIKPKIIATKEVLPATIWLNSDFALRPASPNIKLICQNTAHPAK